MVDGLVTHPCLADCEFVTVAWGFRKTMGGHPISSSVKSPSRINLQTYAADIQFTTLVVGIDNIHYDVFLSPRFVDFTRKYLASLVRQTANVAPFYGLEAKSFRPPETSAFRKLLGELLQASLTRAKF